MNARLNRWIYAAVSVLILLSSLVLFGYGTLQLRYLSAGRRLEARIEAAAEAALHQRWSEADAAVHAAHQEWSRLQGWVYLSHGSDELTGFADRLAELTGAVEAQDLVQVRQAHHRLRTAWSLLRF
jgi:hypothetical protein